MTEAETIRRILRELDWPGPPAAPFDEETRVIQENLGEGAVRWLGGTVDHACRQVMSGHTADMLAPWNRIRVLAHEIAAGVLLELLGAPPTDRPPPAADHRLVEDIVGREIDVAEVVRALRLMQELWLSTLIRAAQSVPDGATAVPKLVQTVTRGVDRACDVLLVGVTEERRLVLHRGGAQVRHMVEALVAGRLPDERTAGETLGFPIGGWHLGCVLHAPPGAAVARGEVDVAVAAFTEATGGQRLLRHETRTGQVWLWASGSRPHRVPTAEQLALQAPIIAGIGEPQQGITGFRRTHVEATEALRIGLLLPGGPRSHRYRDTGLAALLSQDAERARWFVDSELGDLGADSAEMRELRQTLRAYFRAQMRIAPAAEVLYLHRNTLRDRLQRIERILGYQLADRSAECQAALRLCDLVDRPENPPANGRGISGSFSDLRTRRDSNPQPSDP